MNNANTMKTSDQYIPGVCNIGPDEIAHRNKVAWIGLVFTIILWVLFITLDVPALWRLTLFIPATISATGFLQAYMKFCVYFGFANLFNFGSVGNTDTVSQAEYRAKDKKKAWQITLSAILIGIVVAYIGYTL